MNQVPRKPAVFLRKDIQTAWEWQGCGRVLRDSKHRKGSWWAYICWLGRSSKIWKSGGSTPFPRDLTNGGTGTSYCVPHSSTIKERGLPEKSVIPQNTAWGSVPSLLQASSHSCLWPCQSQLWIHYGATDAHIQDSKKILRWIFFSPKTRILLTKSIFIVEGRKGREEGNGAKEWRE